MEDVAVVVIGRNEGQRLERCLRSVTSLGVAIVYVDSGSSDGSVDRVRSLFPQVDVHELSADRPFSAARARNEGAALLVSRWKAMVESRADVALQARPAGADAGVEARIVDDLIKRDLLSPDDASSRTLMGLKIQFIDGDCVVAPGWLTHAATYLNQHVDCAAVIGRLDELRPEASIYNKLCAMEWNSRPGDIEDCGAFGGISMVRANVFERLQGFNASVIAGEDSEFAVRIKLAGYRVSKLDEAMATHDAGMTRFSEFWRRSVRSGHAIGQRYELHGSSVLRDCAKEYRSVQIWGLGLPLVAFALAAQTGGWGLLVWPVGLCWLFSRVWAYRRGLGDEPSAASLYAGGILVTKQAQVFGLLTYWLRRRRNEFQIIEYK